jgi:hypothetical protein
VACSEDGSVVSEVASLTANDDGAGMTNTFMESEAGQGKMDFVDVDEVLRSTLFKLTKSSRLE